MSNPLSLEIQKREVLARIHTSREEYRRMLDVNHPHLTKPHSAALSLPANDQFPRSQLMRWIIANPYWCVGGAVAVALIGPGRVFGVATSIAGTGKTLAGFTAKAAGQTVKLAPLLARWLPMLLNNQRRRAPLQH